MKTKDFILETLGNMQKALDDATNGLTQNEIEWRQNSEANPIGFILWHMLTGEDAFIHFIFQNKPLIWTSDKWYQKLNMPEDPLPGGGYDATAEQIAAFPVPEVKGLLDYWHAVRAETVSFLQNLSDEDIDREYKTPHRNPSMGQLMAELVHEMSQHTGQIAFIRGLQRGINK